MGSVFIFGSGSPKMPDSNVRRDGYAGKKSSMRLLEITNYRKSICRIFILAVLLIFVFSIPLKAQTTNSFAKDNDASFNSAANNSVEENFRVEKVPVAGGAELVTIFVKTHSIVERANFTEETPLISVLRDTLGDDTIENDRLRNVWVLTYTRPSFVQKFAAAVPFLYTRTTNKQKIGDAPPPDVIDLNPSQKDVWNKVFWHVFQTLLLGDFGTPARAATLQYKINTDNYRKSAVARALALLVLYESIEGEKILSETEMKDIQARMNLSDKILGSLVQNENLGRVYQENAQRAKDFRGHNWELLRQYAEAQGLYFEPLEMPDGSQTHVLLWTTEEDVRNNRNKKFDSRFLNIKNPWNDKRLLNWQGYSETRWFDEENRRVRENAPRAAPKKMIPLALYGLDYPKIPTLLIDFRDSDNPKKREISGRILNDLTGNILGVSRFANLPYFVGRYLYSFVTGRRGVDINQASRVESYSQLKLLLSLNESLDPQLRDELSDRIEDVAINPLENDSSVEARLARKQYENLMRFVADPDGLPKRLANERREEMVSLKHGSRKRIFFGLGHLLSFGLYTHREDDTPELRAALDVQRRLEFHERYLRETARDSVDPAIDGDAAAIRRALEFISKNGSRAGAKTAEAVSKIFATSRDDRIRSLCLQSLNSMENSAAKNKLRGVYENAGTEPRWRKLSAEYLHLDFEEGADKPGANEKTAVKND